MSYDEFFTNDDKPYAENINDGLLLVDAFDVSVPCSLPDMFSNEQFSTNIGVNRKAGVSIVALMSYSGVTIGTDTITGTGEVIFRVYPNFNSFYKWYSIVLDSTGDVDISFQTTNGTSIGSTVSSTGIISESSALKLLQPIDVVFTLDSATISNILITFINNQSSNRERVGALLDAGQLANVSDSVSEGDTNPVTGDAIYNELETKEDTSNKVSTLDTDSTHYPSCPAVNTGLALKENVSNKVTTLNSSTTNYPTCSAVTNSLANKADSSHTHTWTSVSVSLGTLKVNPNIRLCEYRALVSATVSANSSMELGQIIPSAYIGNMLKYIPTVHEDVFISLTTAGSVMIWNTSSSSVSVSQYIHEFWSY